LSTLLSPPSKQPSTTTYTNRAYLLQNSCLLLRRMPHATTTHGHSATINATPIRCLPCIMLGDQNHSTNLNSDQFAVTCNI
jgi:hypothetical protein